MVCTTLEPQFNTIDIKGLLASSFLHASSYSFKRSSGRQNTFSAVGVEFPSPVFEFKHSLSAALNLCDLISSLDSVTSPERSNDLGESTMTREISSKSNSKMELIDYLLDLDPSIEVYSHQADKTISFWVVTTSADVLTIKKFCHAFARKVNAIFDDDYFLNFRVLPRDSYQFEPIPQEAKVHKRA